jgi:hypothetical protein
MPTNTTEQRARVERVLVQQAVLAASERGFAMIPSARPEGEPCRVTLVGGKPVAGTCRGFTYHGHCYHVDTLRDVARSVGL